MLVLLMGRFMKHDVDMVSCGIIYVPSVMKICKGIQAVLRSCPRNFRGCNVGITDGKNL
jgi:hypothetical protein